MSGNKRKENYLLNEKLSALGVMVLLSVSSIKGNYFKSIPHFFRHFQLPVLKLIYKFSYAGSVRGWSSKIIKIYVIYIANKGFTSTR